MSNAQVASRLAGETSSAEEEEPLNDFLTAEDLTRVLSQNHVDRMKLTQEEHQRAVLIKNMVEMMPDLDNWSDFMYAQLAIVCKDDVDDAIRRLIGMQDFREEHKILDTYNQGCFYLKKAFGFFPRHFLSFGFNETDGRYVFISDFSQLEPKNFTSPENVDEYIINVYYAHFALLPDLESVRKGYVTMVECQDMQMRRDVLNLLSSAFSSFLTYYPLNGECKHYHTGTMVNIVASMLRKILPDHVRRQYQVGCTFDGGNMAEVLLTPTVEEANKRMLAHMQAALKRRYDNEQSFRLDDD